MIATGVNKTRKRIRGPLFFSPVFFRFLLNKTEKQKTKQKIKQTSKQKESGTQPRWRIDVFLTI